MLFVLISIRASQGFVINTVNIPLSSRYLSADVLKAKTLSELGTRQDRPGPTSYLKKARKAVQRLTKVMFDFNPK